MLKYCEKIEEVFGFLKEVDGLFPIPLSQKTSILDYAKKILRYGKVVVYVIDDEIAGMVLYYANDIKRKVAYLSMIAVLPKYQGRGIASSLIRKLICDCKNAGMESIELFTHKRNCNGIRLYEKHGFVVQKDCTRPGNVKYSINLYPNVVKP